MMFLGALAVVFVVVFGATWVLTRFVTARWLRLLIRVAVVCGFWTPVPLGGAGYWWPAAFAYTDPSYALTAVAGVVGATLVVWLGLLGLARASPT